MSKRVLTNTECAEALLEQQPLGKWNEQRARRHLRRHGGTVEGTFTPSPSRVAADEAKRRRIDVDLHWKAKLEAQRSDLKERAPRRKRPAR